MNNRKGYGVKREHSKWWYKDPVTKVTHGPYERREEAREAKRSIDAQRQGEQEAA